MRRKKRTLMAVVVFALMVAVGAWLRHQISIDSCLDDGGRWDYKQGKCEK